MPRAKTGRPTGRPPKKSPQVIARILKVARTGLPLKFAAQAGNIDAETLSQWRVKDPEFDRALSQARLAAVEEKWKLIQKAAEDRVDADGKLLKAGDWRSLAWSLERAYPAEFARPEVALNLAFQNNTTQNFLSLSISGEEYKEIERVSDPIREKVRAMMENYRPGVLGNGDKNGEPKPIVSIEAEIIQAPVIEHKEGDDSPAFWAQFTGDLERRVESGTAEFVVRTIGAETVGVPRTGEVSFKGNEVTVGDVLDRIERLTPGSGIGWQTLQQKAGFK